MIATTAFVLGIVVIGGATYTNTTLAAEEGSRMSSLVSAIAEKFNLNASEVEIVVNSVLESERSLRGEQGKIHQEERLNQVVEDGKITQAQVDLVTTKLSEMKDDLTEEEKKEKQENFKTWLEENNISMEFFQNKR